MSIWPLMPPSHFLACLLSSLNSFLVHPGKKKIDSTGASPYHVVFHNGNRLKYVTIQTLGSG